MAGTVTKSELVWKNVKKITFDWTCTTGGVASGDTAKYYDGEVLRVVCMETSTTGYAIEINDSDGVDMLGSQGAAMTSGGADFGTSTGGSKSYPLSAVNSKISLSISDGSSGSTGQTIIYVR